MFKYVEFPLVSEGIGWWASDLPGRFVVKMILCSSLFIFLAKQEHIAKGQAFVGRRLL